MGKMITKETKSESERLLSILNRKKKQLGLNQYKVAAMLDMSQGAVGHYLHGRNAINLSIAISLAAILQCKVSDFSPRLAKQINEDNLSKKTPQEVAAETPVIDIKDAASFSTETRIIAKLAKPSLYFKGFYVLVTDNVMQSKGRESIPKGAYLAIKTNDKTAVDEKIYLICSPSWPHPIIRKVVEISGKFMLTTANDAMPMFSEDLTDVHRIIGRAISIVTILD